MTTKKRRTPSRKRKPRKRISRSRKNYKKILKLVSIIVVFFVLSILSLVYLDDSNNLKITNTELNSEIEFVDISLKQVLFDIGMSSDDIISEKIEQISKDNLEWELKESEIIINQSDKKDKLKNKLSGILKSDNVNIEYRSDGKDLKANIKAYGYTTHKLDFRVKYKSKKDKVVSNTKKPPSTKKPSSKADTESPISKYKTEEPDKRLYKNKATIGPGTNKPKIVIIIDDVGLDKKVVDKIIDINLPLNIAILPYLPYSEYAAVNAHKKGMDVLLHLPMEPKESSGYTAEDAGEGVLRVGLSKEAILERLDSNLLSLPHLDGVNNHMGSKFTENRELMEIVLRRLKEKNLYYVDSLTSSSSYGYSLARELGIKTDRRDIFLDNSTKKKEYVISQLDKLVNVANREGVAIGICHPYSQTVEVLADYLPKLQNKVEVATVTSILN